MLSEFGIIQLRIPKSFQNFVNYLVDQLEVNLGFDSGIVDLKIWIQNWPQVDLKILILKSRVIYPHYSQIHRTHDMFHKYKRF